MAAMIERVPECNEIASTKRPRIDTDANIARDIVSEQLLLHQCFHAPSSLYFSSTFGDRDLRLIEVSNDLLEDVLSGAAGEMKMVGGTASGSDLVLCTRDKTYAVKKVETSNHVLFVPGTRVSSGTKTAHTAPAATSSPHTGHTGSCTAKECSDSELVGSYAIEHRCTDYYELKRTSARVEQLETLLRPTEFIGPEAEQTKNHGIPNQNHQNLHYYTHKELREIIQASDTELDKALTEMGVIEISGKMRILGQNAVLELEKWVFDTMIEHDIDPMCVSESALLELLHGKGDMPAAGAVVKDSSDPQVSSFDRALLRHLLGSLGSFTAKTSSSMPEKDTIWCLDKRKIVRANAHILFAEAEQGKDGRKIWDATDFLQLLAVRSPGIEASYLDQYAREASSLGKPTRMLDDLLGGIALQTFPTYCPRLDSKSSEQQPSSKFIPGVSFVYLPVHELPKDVKGRLRMLADTRQSFHEYELSPYFEGFHGGEGQPRTLAELLLSQQSDVRFVDGQYQLLSSS